MVSSLPGAGVKDCIEHDKLIFIINETDIGKAIGKKGVNIRCLEQMFNKKIKMVEFSNDEVQFVKNYLYPLEVSEIRRDDDTLVIVGNDTRTKGLIIGRDRTNLNLLKDIVNRYFKVSEIKVV